MEECKQDIDDVNEKIEKIQNFIALSLRRENISGEARQIIDEAENVRRDIEEANNILKTEFDRINEDYNAVMSRMQDQQARIMNYVIAERERKLQEAETTRQFMKQQKCQKSVKSSAVKDPLARLLTPSLSNLVRTPKISMSEYKASPLHQKRNNLNPIPINFLDFEITLLPEQFELIPKYMRGRETFAEFNEYFEKIIIPCFNEKYMLLHRQRSSVRGQDFELWNLYKEQVEYVPGRNFITIGDISRKLKRLVDKKSLNRMVMLRHIGLLQEQRVNQTTCYIWNQ